MVPCLNVLFSVLKHKVTVGKDTLNIKQAVCCSEVGQVDGMAKRKPEINSIIVRAFVPNNTSSVGLTGIWISFVCCPTFNTRPSLLTLSQFSWLLG